MPGSFETSITVKGEMTALLRRWTEGDENVPDPLFQEIYSELRRIASRLLSREQQLIELQPENLINEAYLKLNKLDRIRWANRTHFFAMSARIMREILIDEARRRNASKRDGGLQITLHDASAVHRAPTTDMLAIHEAMEQLAKVDPERARLVELRFFGGLTIEETAEVMGTSAATVKRHWDVARGWLYRAINSGEEPASR